MRLYNPPVNPAVHDSKSVRVLLTGASGTLGYNIARQLASQTKVHAILPIRRPLLKLAELGTRVEVLDDVELSNTARVRTLISRVEPDVIIHCAASGLRPLKPNWFDLVNFNVEATLRLFEAYCGSTARHFVYVSTGLVYREQGRPLTEEDPIESFHPYGASKAAADLLLQAAAVEFDRPLTIVRPFAFTGLQDFEPRLFPSLLRAAVSTQTFLMTSGDQIRDFCAVEDIARGVIEIASQSPQQITEKFNLGAGVGKTLQQIVKEVVEDLGLAVRVEFGSIDSPEHDPRNLVADINKAKRVLDWAPATRLSYAVWELAQELFPALSVREPERWLCAPLAK